MIHWTMFCNHRAIVRASSETNDKHTEGDLGPSQRPPHSKQELECLADLFDQTEVSSGQREQSYDVGGHSMSWNAYLNADDDSTGMSYTIVSSSFPAAHMFVETGSRNKKEWLGVVRVRRGSYVCMVYTVRMREKRNS